MPSRFVAYTHGPGIDAPLAVRLASGYTPKDIVPLANWRGLYDSGVFTDGSTLQDDLDLKEIEWPAENYRAFFDYLPNPEEQNRPRMWLGSLMTHKRDASGQIYMRNRYFDPVSGRFTQEDPIGIAGGLNLYGFGGGDPMTYSDPYGLKVCFTGTRGEVTRLIGALQNATGTQLTVTHGCITAIENRRGDRELQSRLGHLAFVERRTIDVLFLSSFRDREAETLSGTGSVDDSWYANDLAGGRNYAGVGSGWARITYPTGTWFGGRCRPIGGRRAQTVESILVHELLGHGYHASRHGTTGGEGYAVDTENRYHRQAGEPRRTGYC